jgi:predicted nuclease of predicted toxin-antitoxin system
MPDPLRFLVDQGVSPAIALALTAAGFDAIHVRNIGMAAASDEQIVIAARADNRVIVTQDTGFGGLLVMSRARAPSVILFRERSGRPSVQERLLFANLDIITEALQTGAIVVIEDDAVRVRRLDSDAGGHQS